MHILKILINNYTGILLTRRIYWTFLLYCLHPYFFMSFSFVICSLVFHLPLFLPFSFSYVLIVPDRQTYEEFELVGRQLLWGLSKVTTLIVSLIFPAPQRVLAFDLRVPC
jgi:hypothetical protein